MIVLKYLIIFMLVLNISMLILIDSKGIKGADGNKKTECHYCNGSGLDEGYDIDDIAPCPICNGKGYC